MGLPQSNSFILKERLILRVEMPGPPPFVRIICTQLSCYIQRYNGPWRQDFYTLKISSTSNTLNHYETMHQDIFERFQRYNTVSQPRITQSFTLATNFDQQRFRQLLLHFITQNNLPLRLTESQSFRELASYLNSRVQHGSRRTLSRDIEAAYTLAKGALHQQLQDHISKRGYISLTTDTWTSPAYKEFAAVTVHYIDSNWIQFSQLLGLIHLQEVQHTGEYLARVLRNITDEYNCTNAVFAITRDNASANDVMIQKFEENNTTLSISTTQYPTKFTCINGDVRCFAHIINLAAQELVKQLKVEPSDTESTYAYIYGYAEVIPTSERVISTLTKVRF